MAGANRFKKGLLIALFFVYVIIAASLTIFPLAAFDTQKPNKVNLLPVVNTCRVLYERINTHATDYVWHSIENIFGNIMLLLPLGIFLPLLSLRDDSLRRVIFLAFISSLSIEIIQYVSQYIGIFRFADVDDIILNTIGAAIGYKLYSKIISRSLAMRTS